MSQYENPWTYDNKIFDSDLIGDYYGFVYLITGKQTGRRYIGRKYFWQKRKPRTGSKRRVTSESDWKKYYGSCPELKEDIKEYGKLDFLSNGFKPRIAGQSVNSAQTYIYMAWAAEPFHNLYGGQANAR